LTLTRTWALESRVDLYTDGVRRRVTVWDRPMTPSSVPCVPTWSVRREFRTVQRLGCCMLPRLATTCARTTRESGHPDELLGTKVQCMHASLASSSS
jgi:hypothetical protein